MNTHKYQDSLEHPISESAMSIQKRPSQNGPLRCGHCSSYLQYYTHDGKGSSGCALCAHDQSQFDRVNTQKIYLRMEYYTFARWVATTWFPRQNRGANPDPAIIYLVSLDAKSLFAGFTQGVEERLPPPIFESSRPEITIPTT